jgi:CheY-like chemotaxis protein/two-component sensor histidine kinase
MARLLDDLLDVSRITRSKLEIRKSRVELSTIIDAAIEIARPLIDSRRHAFSVAVPAQPIFVEVDSLRLAQVVGNLLTNAAKYTHTDGRLSLRAQLAEDRVEIRVTDNGLGLRPEDLSRVFEMFVQIGSPPTEGGLGIGLALAKGVTELHGGTIEARSDGPGKGSEFIVRLPAATPIHSALASTPAVTAVDHRRSLRIVVADDNRDAAATLATLLELDGHQVEVAHSGDQALNLIEALRPDIALLDIGMPMLDGYAVARRVRAMAWSTRIKLVAVTGWGQAHDRERAQRAGFDQHWVKPIEAGALLALCASMDAHPPIGANA